MGNGNCCSCQDQFGNVVEIPASPMDSQVYSPSVKVLNRFHASGYDLCIEDVMETIKRSNVEGFAVVQS